MNNQQKLDALYDEYMAADAESRRLEIAWRESSTDFQAADLRMMTAWKKYKAEKYRQENKKEKP